MKQTQEDWNRRCVDFSKVHGNEEEAFAYLVNALQLENGMVVGDLMCGYGEVSRKILEYCAKRHIAIRNYLLDAFQTQIDRTMQHLAEYESQGACIQRVVTNMSYFSLESQLDRAIIKMGLHEVQKDEQERILRRVYLSLKEGGEAYIWESMGQNPHLTSVFREVVRKKDALAGYTNLVENRYFPHESEIYRYLSKVGFKNIETIYEGEFRYETVRMLEGDFKGNIFKLEAWNVYLRENLSDEAKKTIRFTDSGDSMSMSFVKKIIRARK